MPKISAVLFSLAVTCLASAAMAAHAGRAHRNPARRVLAAESVGRIPADLGDDGAGAGGVWPGDR